MAARRRVLAAALVSLAVVACGGDGDDSRSPTQSAEPAATTARTAAPSAAATAPAAVAPPESDSYAAEQVFPDIDFELMLAMFWIPGDEEHAVVLSKDGLIRRASVAGDGGDATTWLDIRGRTIPEPRTEEGLLNLAFAPDFASTREFYLYYSAGDPRRIVVSRFTAGPETADPDSEEIIIEVDQPFANHNGGAMVFGEDGYLYLGLGDGGSSGDPMGNGQRTDVLLGKILRIDVSGDGAGYTIPPDNPFADGTGGRPEIWTWGMRNPWRINFDPETGQLWAGDVGQGEWEEVDLIERGGNYGWNITEGNHCFRPIEGCVTEGLRPARAEYNHDDGGCSITGGYVYRGDAMRELDGWYVYADFCSGDIWAVNTLDDESPPVHLASTDLVISSFAQDPAGELYLVTFGNQIAQLVRAE